MACYRVASKLSRGSSARPPDSDILPHCAAYNDIVNGNAMWELDKWICSDKNELREYKYG